MMNMYILLGTQNEWEFRVGILARKCLVPDLSVISSCNIMSIEIDTSEEQSELWKGSS